MLGVLIFLIGLVINDVLNARTIPSYIPLCRRSDPEIAKCFVNTVEVIRPYLIKGIPELQIPSIDPLKVPKIDVSTKAGSQEFTLQMENGLMYGGKEFKINSFDMDIEKVRFSLVITFPTIVYTGPYKLNGNILLFNINSHGTVNGTFNDVTCVGEWYGSVKDHNGKGHIVFDRIDVNTTAKHGHIQFENLFEGNQALNEAANAAFNENMDLLKEELYPMWNNVIAALLKTFFNRVYELFPVDDLYPRE